MDEASCIKEILAGLRADYEKAAAPWLERLAFIESHRAPAPVLVTREQAEALGYLKREQTPNL